MKVTFIGAGRVGATAAFSAIHAVDSLKEITLVDINHTLAKGEAEDLTHAAYAMERPMKITASSRYPKADIYVVTAGLARKHNQTREELAKTNYSIIHSIGKNIHSGIVITATNPVDAMNYAMWKTTKLQRKKIIGMGGILDTARLHSLGYDGFVLGAHGDGMAPTEKLPPTARKALLASAPSVIKKKGGTIYAPAVSITRMIYAIANDTKETLPCSAVLNGEYALRGLSIGVPVQLGRKGIEGISELPLPPQFNRAAESIKAQIKAIGL